MPVRPFLADAAVRETLAAFLRRRRMHIPSRMMPTVTRLLAERERAGT